ncbi:MAM domain-containing glycosylphosphatidylinositol anchor protein 1-like isoform X2 [Acropora muricata]|uniref:MAM domain-containing glycosylphosphatidylinositol anchor protein 1-like isoform X2 n=1 Tax=Acropora muricata TaxID=159855 RepID=UPI0034E5EFF8
MECYFAFFLFAAVLSIQDSKGFKIDPPYRKVVARQGSDVTLECSTSYVHIHPYDSVIKWTKEGKNIEDNAKTRIQYELPDGRNGFSLNLKNVSTQDAGEYECMVTIYSGAQQKEMKATRELQIFQKVLNIKASQTNVTIVEGSTTTLQCQLKYSEAINVSIFWLFDGKQIKARPLHKGNDQDLITINETLLSLKLTRATRKQGGIYTCGALSAGLRRSLNISVNVTDAEGPELEIKGEAVQNFLKGNTASLSCDAVFPEASFVDTFWTFNGDRIASNERRRKYDNPHSPGSTLSLIIYDMGLSDTGIYACNLNTSHGMAQKNFSIFVKPKVLNVTASQTKVTIVEGSTTTLQCQLKYSKAINVSIFWLFEGKQIKARPFHKGNNQNSIATHATLLQLKLIRVTRKQSGIYTCGALSAGLGSALNISVNVTDAEGPELARIGKAVQVFEKGNTASLSCNAVFPPAYFVDTFWTFNGGRIASNERRRKYDKDNPYSPGSTLSLTIYGLRLNDTGVYACNLNTSHGMAQKNFSIFVQTIDTTEDTRSATLSGDSERTTLFISLGLLVALLTTVMAIAYLKLRSRRPILRRLPRFCLDNPQTTSRASVTFTSVAHE